MRLLPLILFLCCLATGSLFAANVWDFHGGAGINAGRADNPGFYGVENPDYDPNDPRCDPNSASPNPNADVCRKEIAASRRRSATNGSLRVTGGVSANWASTRFDLTYSPFASYYYDQSELSQVSHNLNSMWNHAYTARSTLDMNALVNYTPEQDIDPNAQTTNRVYVNQTNQLAGGFRAGYNFAASAKTTVSGSYRYAVRTYGADNFVDSTTHGAGLNWRRRVTARSFVQTGCEYARFVYGDGPSVAKVAGTPRDPNAIRSRDFDASHEQASVGYGIDVGRSLRMTANAGYNFLQPADARLERSSGLYLNAEADWNGTRLSGAAGYVHSLAGGSGVFTNSRADSMRANLRYAFTPTLSSETSVARNVNERVASGSNQSNESVRTIYARTALNWVFAEGWSANLSYSRFTQDQNGQGAQAPDIRSNRWSTGVSWSLK